MKHYLYLKAILLAFILAFVACGGGGGGDSVLDIEMVSIPGGTFMMGSPGTEPNRNPYENQHSAEVSDFQMSRHQITQAQFERLMKFNPSYFKGTNLPVEHVTWFDAVAFCNALSEEEGLTPVYTITVIEKNAADNITEATVIADWTADGYRLPTEAEWEYACRGDYPNKATETKTKPFGIGIGNGEEMLPGMANFNTLYTYTLSDGHYNEGAGSQAALEYLQKTTSVGSYSPNNYGLYDMHGNVYEWCWDYWHDTYEDSPPKDHAGPGSGTYRVLRGGSWNADGRHLRSAYRGSSMPHVWYYSSVGFRVVCSP